MEMDWCLLQPKIELHAHLNGSIRGSTLLELAKVSGEKGVLVFEDVENLILKGDRSLVECFKFFDLIHLLTTDHTTVKRITKEVIEDFASENIVYVELRTTPKKNAAIGMTKRSYIEAVIDGLRSVDTIDVDFIPSDMNQSSSTTNISDDNGITRKKIYVRLLLSIDRRETTASAMETVELALEMRDLGVVGIDLSGNPIIGEWATFLPALRYAKEQGLAITLHCGEAPDRDIEISAMLDFLPERIGHGCCIRGEELKKLKSSEIPVEICLTSNIRTKCFPSIEYHHFDDLYKSKHPIVLCTDDPWIFSTTLSREYNLAATSFGLGKEDMFKLARSAIECIFADAGVKKKLREVFDSAENQLML